MYKKAITFILAGFLLLPAFSQSEQEVQTFTKHSEILNEERELKIYLPADYSPDQVYPVIYITDAAWGNFKVAKGYLDALSDPQYRVIPPSILVGIVHKKRNEEMNVFGEESGQKFMKYLFDEVVPNIDATFSTSGFNTMIGHSNGAEWNHFLMMAEDNPFRGFISLSTAFNTDVKAEIAEFFKTYQGKNLYYFVGNGKSDGAFRIQAGKVFETLYEKNPNEAVRFTNQTFEGNHNSLVPNAMLTGLKFIFQDFGDTDNYAAFTEYQDHYKEDVMEAYGLNPAYEFASIESYFADILTNKDKEQYQAFVAFANKHKLWYNPGGILDPVNIANQYCYMEMYPETIEYYNRGLNELDVTGYRGTGVEPGVYISNIPRVIKAYEEEGRDSEIMPFLIQSREALGDAFRLRMNYQIAKYALENETALDEGNKALAYCKANYKENRYFSIENINALEERM